MFAKENPLWRTTSLKTLPWWSEEASLKDFNIPTESWEQITQDRTNWRGLIRRGAGENEAKRISEAEQKRTQRKARAKASPTELSSSDLSCSICNRQFRAKIGLISHLRTHITQLIRAGHCQYRQTNEKKSNAYNICTALCEVSKRHNYADSQMSSRYHHSRQVTLIQRRINFDATS